MDAGTLLIDAAPKKPSRKRNMSRPAADRAKAAPKLKADQAGLMNKVIIATKHRRTAEADTTENIYATTSEEFRRRAEEEWSGCESKADKCEVQFSFAGHKGLTQ
jgi:hypothetical protein